MAIQCTRDYVPECSNFTYFRRSKAPSHLFRPRTEMQGSRPHYLECKPRDQGNLLVKQFDSY